MTAFDLTVDAGELVDHPRQQRQRQIDAAALHRPPLDPTDGEVRVGGQRPRQADGRRAARGAPGAGDGLPARQSGQAAQRAGQRRAAARSAAIATCWTALGGLPSEELRTRRTAPGARSASHLGRQRAGTLSGGQAQRVAIARALAQRPQVLLADEPVASLDPEAAEEIMRLLRQLATDERLAVLCVLHQPELAARYSHRVVGLRDGGVAFDLPPPSCAPSAQIAGLYRDDGGDERLDSRRDRRRSTRGRRPSAPAGWAGAGRCSRADRAVVMPGPVCRRRRGQRI